MSHPLIRVEGLRWSFPQAEQALFQALSFDLPAGVSWLGGDEGRGKTTLLRLLAGQLSPQAGRITIAPGSGATGHRVAWHEPAGPAGAWSEPGAPRRCRTFRRSARPDTRRPWP